MSVDTTAVGSKTIPTAPAAAPPAPATDGSIGAVAVLPDPGGDGHRGRDRRRRLARGLRRGLLLAALAGATVLVVLALRPRPAPVDIARATRGPLLVVVEESGKTRVKDRYVVSSPVAGNVSRVQLEPGDTVNQGDILAELAPALSPLLDQRTRAETEARLGAARAALGQSAAQVARAAAAKDLAAQELARMTKLASAGSLARQPLEQASFEARMRTEELTSAIFAGKVAAEEVRLAEASLARGGGIGGARDRHVEVLAPVSGRVLRVMQKSAGVVPAGTPLVEVGDPAALEIVVDLLTTVAVQVRPGTPAVIQDWGGDGPLEGRVRLVEPSGFTRPSALGVDEQRVNVVIAVTDPHEKWAALGDGYRVEVRLVLWRGDDVLQIPQGAVFRNGADWAAFRIDGDRVTLVPIELGHRGETMVEILAGLSPDATVAVHPGERVKPGARVEAR